MIRKEEVFKIGRFAKPHGIKGEIALVTDSAVLDAAAEDEDLYVVCEMDGILVPFFIEEYRYKTDSVVLLKLENVDDEQAARQLANRDVFYPLAKVDEAERIMEIGWEYLIGFRIIGKEGTEIGRITNVDDSTANVLLQVMDAAGRERLLPVVEAWITSLDDKNRTVVMTLPDGLLDL